jgi:hypothetical protein
MLRYVILKANAAMGKVIGDKFFHRQYFVKFAAH